MKTWLSLLGICVLLGVLLSGTHQLTNETIQTNRAAAQRAILIAQVKPQRLPSELIWQQGYLAICQQLTLESVVAGGYGGPMTLLLTYQRDVCDDSQTQCAKPSLRNVVVSAHAETPGIGDFFESTHPNWLPQLRSLAQAQPLVDTVSGATITATALRNAVAAALNVGTAIPFASNPCQPPIEKGIETSIAAVGHHTIHVNNATNIREGLR